MADSKLSPSKLHKAKEAISFLSSLALPGPAKIEEDGNKGNTLSL